MKWRLVVLGTLILLSVIALGAYRLLAGSPSIEVTLDANDNGRQIEIEEGQILVVALESTPSTGYRWETVGLEEDILQQVGETEFQSKSDAVGVSGVEIFRFKAVGAGGTTLKLVYHRPWEKSVDPLKTFSCQVMVR